jgi:hypothetical protein
MNTLFQKVVVATGISELFAVHAVARACERAGVDPQKLSPASLKVALPEIEKTVQTFCHHDLEQIMPRLHLLTRH